MTISGDGGCDDEIEQRIGAAARVVGAMRKEVLERRELQKTTKMRVLNAMVVPTLLYGYESWTILKKHESKLQAFKVMDIVKEKQRKWKDIVEAMSEDRLVKKVYMDEATGRRPRGPPKKRWQDNFLN